MVVTILIGCLVLVTPIQAAAESATVTVRLEELAKEQIFNLWEVGSTDTLAELYQQTDEELTKHFGNSKQQMLQTGASELKMTLEVGKRYYLRQVVTETLERMIAPVLIEVTSKEPITIMAKYTVPRRNGGHKFVKISSKGGTLADARFQVEIQKEDGTYQVVQKEGEPYTVLSSENGEFSVEGLPYGRYYLREINAPKGYQLLKEPVAFEVTNVSEQTTVKPIKNEPTPPPLIEIPYTGNAIIIIVVFTAFLLFMSGWYLIKKDSSDKE